MSENMKKLAVLLKDKPEMNEAINEEIKKAIKAALKAFKAKPSKETLAKAQSEYDKAVKKDLMKKNTAARRKAKLHAMAKEAGVKLA